MILYSGNHIKCGYHFTGPHITPVNFISTIYAASFYVVIYTTADVWVPCQPYCCIVTRGYNKHVIINLIYCIVLELTHGHLSRCDCFVQSGLVLRGRNIILS